MYLYPNIRVHTHTHIIGENVVFPSCSNPPAVNTKLSYSLLIGVTVGSTIPAVCFIFIVGVSVPFLLYKRKRYSPKNSLHATSHVVYSHHYQGSNYNYMVISLV